MSFSNTTDRIISISAIVIAIVSIFISVWEGQETRKHNRLSVQPKIEIFFNSLHDGFSYVLVNNGLGPAIITDKKLYVDDVEVNYTGFSGLDDFLNKLDLNERYKGHGALGKGVSIKEGKNINIISFNYLKTDQPEKLREAIYQRISIEIKYKSIYGEKFTCKIPR